MFPFDSLFAHRKVTAKFVIGLLDSDKSERSGRMREFRTGKLCEPREIYICADHGGEKHISLWIREDGRYVSGWVEGAHHGVNFGLFDAPLIRRAVRRWLIRNGEEL